MKKILLGVAALVVLAVLFVFSITLEKYPKLDSCFTTSISQKLLCSKNSDYVKLESVSEYFLKAVVISEDDKFYAHDGFDWKELRKSMEANFRNYAFVRGGSTITQQLVKNVYLTREKTITRKIIEARLASRIEKEHSKKLILEKYVNAIEFGKDIWGIKQAAGSYFQKTPAELNPLEALYLVVLLPSPVRYSKTFYEKKLSSYQKKRMLTILKTFKRRKVISPNQFDYLESSLEQFLNLSGVGDLMHRANFYDESKLPEENDEEVVQPEEGEMADTEIKVEDVIESENTVDSSDLVESNEAELKEENNDGEESYSEEETVVEDEDPDLDIDKQETEDDDVD